LDIDAFVLPEGWEWEGDWAPFVNEKTDAEGWRYAKTFDSGDWKPKAEGLDLARTRELVRFRKYTGLGC
jgi:hypothetical protein